MSEEIALVGIDCATQPSNVGLALGVWRLGSLEIRELGNREHSPQETITHWLNQRTRTGRARGRARRAETSVVIASGGERSLDALGLRAGGTPGSRTPGFIREEKKKEESN